MDLFFVLLILLVITRSFGEMAERLGQPALVGELVAGIVLGTLAVQYTDFLPQLTALEDNAVFDSITDLGMFFIMLFAGVELQPSRLMAYSKGAFSVALGGMVLPMALGIGLAWLFFPAIEIKRGNFVLYPFSDLKRSCRFYMRQKDNKLLSTITANCIFLPDVLPYYP